MDEIKTVMLKGRHAAPDNMIIRNMPDGTRAVMENRNTRMDPERVHVSYSAHEGGVVLRLDDDDHSDFWLEFALDIPTLEMLLAKSKGA